MWLIPSANATTRGVWSTNDYVGAVLLVLRFVQLLGLRLARQERLRSLGPLFGTTGALDGNSGDILNDDGSRS